MNDDTKPTDVSAITPTLEQVRQRFESWRQRRKKRTRIPQKLWQAAISLSEEYSIHHLSKTLRINHTALKNKVKNASLPEQCPSDRLPTPFIELPATVVPLLESTIEMIKDDGSLMRMRIRGAACSDLMELGKAFWAMGS